MGDFLNNLVKPFTGGNDDEYYDEEYDEEYDEYDEDEYSSTKKNSKTLKYRNRRQSLREVCIIKPTSYRDAMDIADSLLNIGAVVVNLEGLHVEISQRIIDFISGTCYALNGHMEQISESIVLVTNRSVGISGDFVEQQKTPLI